MIDEEEPLVRRNKLWVRFVAAIVAVSLLLFTGIYVANFFRGNDEGPPLDTDVSDTTDPGDRPAAPAPCGTTESVEPVPDGDDVDRQIAAIEDRIEVLRGLEFKEEVETEFLTDDEIAAEVDRLNSEGYTESELDRDERILHTLGFMPEEETLPDVLDALAGQVAGFYDPTDGRMVVGSADGSLSPSAELTLAHELEHALADQVFGLPLEEEPSGPELDASLAARSLVEGDATLLQQHYATVALSRADAAEILNDPSTQQALQDLGDVPYPLQRAFEFPYIQGLAFVCQLYSEGGWAAVDAAYENLPTTSAQILFPHRYATREEAAKPPKLGRLSGGWERIEKAALGAADLLFMFQAPGGDPALALADPLGSASGWAGGTMHAYRDGDDTAVGMSLVQRRPEDGLCSALQAWMLAAFGGDIVATDRKWAVRGDERAGIASCDGDSVIVGVGPTLDVAEELLPGGTG